jgi:hypothetical protein
MPGGLYVWEFRFPLFDCYGPSLSCSNRIVHSLRNAENILAQDKAKSVFEDSSQYSVSTLLNYLEKAEGALDNEYTLFNYAVGLVLIDEKSRAVELLANFSMERLAPSVRKMYEPLRENILTLPIESNLEYMSAIRQENLGKFDLLG